MWLYKLPKTIQDSVTLLLKYNCQCMFITTRNRPYITGHLKVFREMEPNARCMFPAAEKLQRLLLISPASSCEAARSFSALHRLKTWLRSTMTQIRLIHVVIRYVHRDILNELSCQDMAKEFVRTIDARCRVFGKFKYYPDVHDKQRYDLGVLLGHCRAQSCQLMASQKYMLHWNCIM